MKTAHRLIALLALAACNPPELGQTSSPIIGGTDDSGDPAVVLLAAYPANHSTLATCTAVVISPTVLLTAAHCVDSVNHPGYTYGVFIGDNANIYPSLAQLEPHLLPVSAVHAHPAYDPDPPFHADVGVVIMAQPLTIAPLPIQRDPLTAAIAGESARLIGYGQRVYGNYNASRVTTNTTVVALDAADTVQVGDASHLSCVGDSGGPALAMMGGVETVIGLDSYSDTTGCTEPSHYQRTDVYLDFFDTYAPPETGGAGGEGATVSSSSGSTSSATSVSATTAAGATSSTSATSGSSGGGSDDGSDDGGCSFVSPGETSHGSPMIVAAVAVGFGISSRRRSRKNPS